ncbi:hypothetical protein GYA27_04975, partial [candidate division WWE3 bacterium]|nr:hypothetical protein [candidate division WWE3 bacterium]
MHQANNNELPTELFSSQFEQIETVEDSAERAFYYAVFGYDLIMDQCRALEDDRSKTSRVFARDADYESYLLPGVGGNESYEILLRTYHSPEKPFQQSIYEVGGFAIARVPQCFMYSFPLDSNPLLYLSMTECSALVAHNEQNLFVAHI